MTVRVLTGINTTGTLHLGNYCGALRPCVRASKNPDVESFFFLADLHALIKCQDPERLERSRLQIAACWLAAGLDPDHVTLYRQSDIPEIPLLNWMLNCVCSKGLMNRAHAYKAFVEANAACCQDVDAGVSMGLFCYPVLMTADILMFNANRVPVGRDQIQHLEMARDIATRFNNTYGRGKDFFVLPFEAIDENVALLPGLDGRKMSKSYNNVIPLFDGGEKALREAISHVVTDSKLPGEPKDPDSTSLTLIYDAFATKEQSQAFRAELRDGLGWGEAKNRLADKINEEIGPMREKYEYYIAHPDVLEDILQQGALKARKIATPFIEELRHAVGLRSFTKCVPCEQAKKQGKKACKPLFKQYREKDGKFYFKLESESGRLLLVSNAFDSGKEAGMTVCAMKSGCGCMSEDIASKVNLCEGVTPEDVKRALALLAA